MFKLQWESKKDSKIKLRVEEMHYFISDNFVLRHLLSAKPP